MKSTEEFCKNRLSKQDSAIELTNSGQEADRQLSHVKMITTKFDGQIAGLDAETGLASSSAGAINQVARRRIARQRRPANGTEFSKVKNDSMLRLVLLRLIWSACRVISSSLALHSAVVSIMIVTLMCPSMTMIKCDDELHAQLSNLLSDNSDQNHKSEFYDIIQSQRDGRSQNDPDDNEDSSNDKRPDQAATIQTGDNLQALQNEAIYNQADERPQSSQVNENRAENEAIASEQLDTAQTNSQSNSVSAAASEQKNTQQPTAAAAPSDANNQAQTVSSTASTTATLSDHLNAVNKLIQQAGQLGLSAAQQNVALSEAIINSVTNTLSGSAATNRRPQVNQTPATASSAAATVPSLAPNVVHSTRPGVGGNANLVGQGFIDGNINYDPNSSTINGFIDFPNFPNLGNFTNSLPSLNGAVKPLLMAAIKTAPVKIGSVTWKLLKLLAWKKIYKAHHPKSGEIIIEQEIKPTANHIVSDGKGSKIKDKINDHFEGKFRGSKMGQGSFGGDDWMTMMRSTGPAGFHGDMFLSGVGGGGGGGAGSGAGWPHGDSQASASMIYQRHLLPGTAINAANSATGQQQAAAVAAAAAATAAAIQSQWTQQHHQQMVAEEMGESKTNQTNARRRSRSGPYGGGGNWFAANPAHAYAAATAAATAAAAMATQQQQQQRLINMMRAYDSQNHYQSPDMMHGDNNVNSGLQHALATGMMYQSLFDNAASMAVQNVVKLPPTHMNHHHHMNHLGGDDLMDQSDSLSGSPLGSLTHTSLGASAENLPMGLMQRHDGNQPREQSMEAAPSDNLAAERAPGSNFMALSDYPASRDLQTQSMLHRSNSFSESVTDFDDTPAGKILNNPINYGSYYSSRRMD